MLLFLMCFYIENLASSSGQKFTSELPTSNFLVIARTRSPAMHRSLSRRVAAYSTWWWVQLRFPPQPISTILPPSPKTCTNCRCAHYTRCCSRCSRTRRPCFKTFQIYKMCFYNIKLKFFNYCKNVNQLWHRKIL